MADDPWTYKRAGLDREAYGESIGDIGHIHSQYPRSIPRSAGSISSAPGGKGSTGFASLFALDYDRWLFSKSTANRFS